jgi:hypothetical protein
MSGDIQRQRTTQLARLLRASVLFLFVASVTGITFVGDRAMAASPTDKVTISPASATEGDAVTFTIALPDGVMGPVTGTFRTDSGSGNATDGNDCDPGDDYDDVATPDTEDATGEEETGSFSIDLDKSSTTVQVPTCADAFAEPNETFTVTIVTVVGAAPCMEGDENCSATGTILNNDDAPAQLSIADAGFTEAGGAQTFTLTLNTAAGQSVDIDYHTEDDTAEAGSDYTEVETGTATIPATGTTTTQTTASAAVTITQDPVAEANETFTLVIDRATNVATPDTTAVGTILDDDSVPEITIVGDDANEGETGTGACTDAGDPDPTDEEQCVVFAVSLSAATGQEVGLDFATVSQTATSPQDYLARNGHLTFAAGSDTDDVKFVTVRVNGDTTAEGNETFLLRVSNASNAQCPGATATCDGVGRIAEGAIPITVDDASGTEGTTTTNVSVDINLDAAPDEPMDVGYHTSDGTAKAGDDYSPTAADAQVTFAAGDQTETVQIPVFADTLDEDSETFFVTAEEPAEAGTATCSDGDCTGQVTIADETGDTPPSLSINDPTPVAEGNSETKTVTFTVSLSAVSGRQVTVNFATANGPSGNTGAVGGSACTGTVDYLTTSGTVTFAAGETSKSVPVTICGDEFSEADSETFFVNLSGASNATVADAQGVGTITNDDGAAPALSISDRTASEGNSGKTAFNFTVTLSAESEKDVTVTYNTDAGTPTAATSSVSGSTACDPGIDYIGALATVTIPAGSTTQTITVDVCGDTRDEAAEERFVVKLSNPVTPHSEMRRAWVRSMTTIPFRPSRWTGPRSRRTRDRRLSRSPCPRRATAP